MAVTKAGKPCAAPPTASGYCAFHDPSTDARELGRAGGRASGRTRRGEHRPTLREQAEEALIRALEGGNHAAAVAAAKQVLGGQPLDPPAASPERKSGVYLPDGSRLTSLDQVVRFALEQRIGWLEETLRECGWVRAEDVAARGSTSSTGGQVR